MARTLEPKPYVKRKKRIKLFLFGLQVAFDVLMLILAFFLAYLTRTFVPILTLPANPPGFLERYIP
ncbi:MAG: hypothetical protein ACLFTK_16815, partial [Anaerolineales bacterium]